MTEHADWPWAWYGLGLARVELAELRQIAKPGPLQPLGTGYAEGAQAALMRALKLDRRFVEARDALVGLVEAGRVRGSPGEVLGLLRFLNGLDSVPRQVLLARGRLELQAGNPREAAEAYRRFFAGGGDPRELERIADDSLRAALTAELTRQPRPAVAALALQANLELESGQADSALTTLERFRHAGGDSSVYWFGRSRALYQLADTHSGETAYYRGASACCPSPRGREVYRRDIQWIADSTELASFDSLPAARIEPWLRAFWGRRDLASGRPLGARLAEHRRRVHYALIHYHLADYRRFDPRWWALQDEALRDYQEPAPGPGSTEVAGGALPGRIQALRTDGQGLVDGRGVIYIRHGEPDLRANYAGIGHWWQESWRYNRAGEPLVVHFAGKIGEVPPQLFLIDQPPGDLMDACAVDGLYCVMAGRAAIHDLTQDYLARIRDRDYRRGRRGATTDDFALTYDRDLRPVVQFYALPTQVPDLTRFLIVIALPGGRLEGLDDSTAAGVVYRVHTRLLAGRSDSLMIQRDSTRRFVVGAPVSRDAFLAGTWDVRLEPGTWDLSLVVDDSAGRAGGFVRMPGMILSRFDGGRLTMSDIILGKLGAGLETPLEGTRISLNPLNAYARSDTAQVYYVLDGLTPGARYRTTMGIYRGSSRRLSVGFTDTYEAARVLVQRSLVLRNLSAGNYRLRITVTEENGPGRIVQEQALNMR